MAAKGDAFWDITNHYKNYKELINYPKEAWEYTKLPDGKNYAIPRPRPVYGGENFIGLRQDWLDKLKLKVPQNTEELYNVVKAFVNNDPDGNGQKDTPIHQRIE